MNLDTIAHLSELIVSCGVAGILWKANRLINKVWDAIQTAPPHLHIGKDRIFYPPPFKKPQMATIPNGDPDHN